MEQHFGRPAKAVLDTALGVGGVTGVLWLEYLAQSMKAVAAMGGALLVLMRLYLTYLDWKLHRNIAAVRRAQAAAAGTDHMTRHALGSTVRRPP